MGQKPKVVADDIGRLSFDSEENTAHLTTWVFEEGTFVPQAKIVDGKSYSIISDYLGTPILSYDENGNKVWERELDIYGKVISGDNGFIPFLYQGQYYDAEIELAYNRFRYYSPDTGMYISQDPIGLEGGMPNFYAYVKDSNSWIDPFGLDCLKNKTNGLAREKKVQGKLEAVFGKDNVLRERTLLDSNRKKVVGPDGTGRRVDFVVLDDAGNAKYVVEVTSETANKVPQIAKETFIRNNGGEFIKIPGKNGSLVDISNTPTRIIRLP